MNGIERASALLMMAGSILALSACAGALPSKLTETRSPWMSFDQAKVSYDLIVPGETRLEDLEAMGFDPVRTPNVRLLNYLDLIAVFLPHQSMRRDDLDPALRACLDAREACYGFEVQPGITRQKRHGNVALDLFGFRRETTTTGWRFNSLIVLQDDIVAYKVWSGEPNIEREDFERKPLGPLQNSGETIIERAVY
jgi:hypothetical protein